MLDWRGSSGSGRGVGEGSRDRGRGWGEGGGERLRALRDGEGVEDGEERSGSGNVVLCGEACMFVRVRVGDISEGDGRKRDTLLRGRGLGDGGDEDVGGLRLCCL